jgi:hypothetical protein
MRTSSRRHFLVLATNLSLFAELDHVAVFNLAATDWRHDRLMLRRAILVLPLVFAAATASAADGTKEGAGDVGQYVDLQPVGLPIVARGQLVNYVFVYIRVNLTNSANAAKLREHEPYFRDALVRAAHRTPFTVANDYTKIDEPRLTAALFREASAITGPGQIRSVVVTSQQPRRRLTAPSA